MSEGISQEEYDDEVAQLSERLTEYAAEDVRKGEYDDFEHAVLDISTDVLDGHQWFARSYHGPADHGAVIEYATDAGVDPIRYSDLTTAADSEDPARIVRLTAYICFEAHVIERALA